MKVWQEEATADVCNAESWLWGKGIAGGKQQWLQKLVFSSQGICDELGWLDEGLELWDGDRDVSNVW